MVQETPRTAEGGRFKEPKPAASCMKAARGTKWEQTRTLLGRDEDALDGLF